MEMWYLVFTMYAGGDNLATATTTVRQETQQLCETNKQFLEKQYPTHKVECLLCATN